jgi:hypothetical protein
VILHGVTTQKITISNATKTEPESETKILIFWDVTLCSLVQMYRCFRGTYFYPEDGCGGNLQNVKTLLQDYTLSHPRRRWVILIFFTERASHLAEVSIKLPLCLIKLHVMHTHG